MFEQYVLACQQLAQVAMVISVIAGLCVLEYSVLEGIFMVWDKLVHGKPIFD